jgi:hypothetical protein
MSDHAQASRRVEVSLWPWRPLYWEPVPGTGERIMVGVVHAFAGEVRAVRTIRDDVLDCLFGKASSGLRRLIDHSLSLYQAAGSAVESVAPLEGPLAGIFAGPLRATEAASAAELLQTACLLYSSLGNLDKLDESEESDAPQQDEVNRRFGSEVKAEVAKRRPDLVPGFGRGGVLIEGGQKVKFGYFSPKAVLHFTVLHPVRQSASVRDARARIFELHRAREIARIDCAALIAAVPRDDDATLGSRQRELLRANRLEIEAEADSMNLRWHAVTSAAEGADRLIDTVDAAAQRGEN